MDHLFDLYKIAPAQRPQLGSKSINLGRLMRAGLPVPPGFCIDDTLEANDPAIAAAYRALGSGLVAVRSSAAGEDEAEAAAAGVYASRLGVRDETELTAAIENVRRSARAAHVRAYQPGGPAPGFAVIVQRLVDAVVAGVVFTRDPADDDDRHTAVAAAWGLGTTVVGGAAADRFRIDRATGRLVEQVIAHKPTRRTATGIETVAADRADAACLTAAQLLELSALSVAAEQILGEPSDVEWALADGRFWLLQARPITVSPARDLERLREREIKCLRALADLHWTVWVRYHLAESAPHPTPMTWAVLQSMLSVHGGYGRMLRNLGFDPDPRVDDTGFVQLIAGQPYLNIGLEARLDHRDIPYAVDVDRLKRDPALALLPQRELLPERTPFRFWRRLPVTLWRVWRQARRLRRLRDSYGDALTARDFPAFAEEVTRARTIELSKQPAEGLIALFQQWRHRTLVEFAGAALQPAVFANLALHDLTKGVPESERERRVARLQELLAAASRSAESDQPAALHAILTGSLDVSAFLDRFGHRGPEELELAQPRWREVPPELGDIRGPRDRRREPLDLAAEPPAVRQYCAAVGLRETSRHFFMLGYSFLRDVLLELDRRFQLAGGIFFLTPDELSDLADGAPVIDRIRTRRREHNLLRSLMVPAVVFSDDLAAIGRTEKLTTTATWTGRPISPGQGEGPAVVATAPEFVVPGARRGFVLVCPFADAIWLPVLVDAAAVILETGTDLSHGAILLRELGIPAVAGVPGVMAAIVPGERLRVDGGRGEVTRLGRD